VPASTTADPGTNARYSSTNTKHKISRKQEAIYFCDNWHLQRQTQAFVFTVIYQRKSDRIYSYNTTQPIALKNPSYLYFEKRQNYGRIYHAIQDNSQNENYP